MSLKSTHLRTLPTPFLVGVIAVDVVRADADGRVAVELASGARYERGEYERRPRNESRREASQPTPK
jgi:hypothetical protein